MDQSHPHDHCFLLFLELGFGAPNVKRGSIAVHSLASIDTKTEEAKQLIANITSKASGVFLWVVMTVKSLLEGLADGDRVSDLQNHLEDIPDELEQLSKILHGLKGRYFDDAARLFRMHRTVSTPPTVLTLSFADEDDAESLRRQPVGALAAQERFIRSLTMKRRLNARCRGLLEIGGSHHGKGAIAVWDTRDLDELLQKSDSEDSEIMEKLAEFGQVLADCHVQYLHQSVKDYLQEPEVWAAILDATRSAPDPVAALCISYLHQMKTMELGRVMSDERGEFLWLLELFFESAVSLPSYNTGLYIEMIDLLDETASLVASAPCYHGTATSLVEKVWGLPAATG